MKREVEIKRSLRDWIVRTSDRVEAKDVSDRTPLVSRGILKSVHVMDLILYLEELLEGRIDVERIAPGSFASIDAIYQTFFAREDGRAARSR